MFHCGFCTYSTRKLTNYLRHHKSHESLTLNIMCGYDKCRKVFKREGSLRVHLLRSHDFHLYDCNADKFPRVNCADQHGKYSCTDALCSKQFDNSKLLMKHLKRHMKQGQAVQCPYRKCKKVYNKVKSFTGHLTKFHRGNCPISNTEDVLSRAVNDDGEVLQTPPCEASDILGDNNDRINEDADSSTEDCDPMDDTIRWAQFFLKLETQCRIPSATVQYIASQVFAIYGDNEDKMHSHLLSLLRKKNINEPEILEVVEEVFKCNPSILCHASLGSTYKRRKYYQKKFPYVEPERVSCKEANKYFHYVPIEQTLKNAISSKSWGSEWNCTIPSQDDDVLRDFTDGRVFRNNKFFQENPNALKFILYQDSFEVVNPLGSARKKHKILAIYLLIGNLPVHLRSQINSIQLVALCKEKNFDHEKVYGRIVDDLIKIEDNGILLSSGEVIRGAVVFIAGDNLGSNGLGGFTENFSTAPYFCRYCTVCRELFYSENGATKYYSNRTPESYNEITKVLAEREAEALVGDGNNTEEYPAFDSKGIKFNSAFNRLKYFHVCNPGLPPCLAHDLFEGLITYDVKIFLDVLVKKEKWFSYETLNQRIKSFSYSTEDRRDKPCVISPVSKKLTGGAWQLWTFLRLLPLLIGDKIKNVDNEAWRSIILLTEIIEIVIAPEVHKHILGYLRQLIYEYITLRKQKPQKLRPKHHFLLHYPGLILQFGPLMKTWTLRFESKHSFFKNVLRSTKNFLNVTKTAAIKHELYQSFLRMGADVRNIITTHKGEPFYVNHYHENIRKIVNSKQWSPTLEQCSRIVVKGVSYEKGNALFISHVSYQCRIEIGRIIILLHDQQSDEVHFVVELLENKFMPHLRCYQLGKFLQYACVNYNDLPSIEKLTIYNTGSFLCVKPNYGLVSKGL